MAVFTQAFPIDLERNAPQTLVEPSGPLTRDSALSRTQVAVLRAFLPDSDEHVTRLVERVLGSHTTAWRYTHRSLDGVGQLVHLGMALRHGAALGQFTDYAQICRGAVAALVERWSPEGAARILEDKPDEPLIAFVPLSVIADAVGVEVWRNMMYANGKAMVDWGQVAHMTLLSTQHTAAAFKAAGNKLTVVGAGSDFVEGIGVASSGISINGFTKEMVLTWPPDTVASHALVWWCSLGSRSLSHWRSGAGEALAEQLLRERPSDMGTWLRNAISEPSIANNLDTVRGQMEQMLNPSKQGRILIAPPEDLVYGAAADTVTGGLDSYMDTTVFVETEKRVLMAQRHLERVAYKTWREWHGPQEFLEPSRQSWPTGGLAADVTWETTATGIATYTMDVERDTLRLLRSSDNPPRTELDTHDFVMESPAPFPMLSGVGYLMHEDPVGLLSLQVCTSRRNKALAQCETHVLADTDAVAMYTWWRFIALPLWQQQRQEDKDAPIPNYTARLYTFYKEAGRGRAVIETAVAGMNTISELNKNNVVPGLARITTLAIHDKDTWREYWAEIMSHVQQLYTDHRVELLEPT